jgi:hypothetical protein
MFSLVFYLIVFPIVGGRDCVVDFYFYFTGPSRLKVNFFFLIYFLNEDFNRFLGGGKKKFFHNVVFVIHAVVFVIHAIVFVIHAVVFVIHAIVFVIWAFHNFTSFINNIECECFETQKKTLTFNVADEPGEVVESPDDEDDGMDDEEEEDDDDIDDIDDDDGDKAYIKLANRVFPLLFMEEVEAGKNRRGIVLTVRNIHEIRERRNKRHNRLRKKNN